MLLHNLYFVRCAYKYFGDYKLAVRKNQIALVLGSGGARGLAHIGVIKALEENDIPIDIIAGTSIGAFIGGLYACGIDVNKMENIIAKVDKLMVAKFLFPKLFSPGFIDSKRVAEYIRTLIGDKKIENLKIPFATVSTNLITGEQIVFKKGSVVDAIMASIAIPAIFEPVFLNNRYLIDGGLSNPLPISVAMEMKAHKIIAVNVSPNPKRIARKIKTQKQEEAKLSFKKLPSMFTNLLNDYTWFSSKNGSDMKKDPRIEIRNSAPNLWNVFFQSFSISTNNLMAQQLRYAKPDILISPKVEDFDMLEFYKGHEIINCGYNSVQKAMPEILANII